jgi:uncharacterized protein (DUF433 family)
MRWGKGLLLELRKGQAMAKEYVEKRNGGYYIAGTRVSLDSIVYEFLNGASPEAIRHSFSALSLEQVYGGITFYLANQREIDEYLEDADRDFEKLRLEARKKHPLLYQKLDEARRNLHRS